MIKKATNSVFVFDSYSVNPESKEFKFHYRLLRLGEELSFTETLLFPSDLDWQDIPLEAMQAIMQALHIALGVSYWKIYCPKDLRLPEYSLSRAQADFWNKVYTEGMGEFYYVNKLDFRGLVKFPVSSNARSAKAAKLKNKNKSLLFFGGGKDSWTSYELLKRAKKDFTPFAIVAGKSQSLKSILPKGSIIVNRLVDPTIAEASKKKGAYEGHVPISMMWALVGELAAMLYGFRYVIASNERSANQANVSYLGMDINHQWSKSLEAEKALQAYSKQFITPSVTYFSILRPLYEFKIVEIFSRLGRKHFYNFTSCNRNFRMRDKAPGFVWCNECPKCAFVFAMLSAFLPKKDLVKIFGENLFAKKDLLPLFNELLGIKGIKPFECVGTPEEVTVAMGIALANGEYDGDSVMELFAKNAFLRHDNMEKLYDSVVKLSKNHLIPKEFLGVLNGL